MSDLVYEEFDLPPVGGEDLLQLSKREAKQYFDWFMARAPERLAYLKDRYTATGGTQSLDETPESLVPLWTWMTRHISYRPRTDCEIIKAKNQMLAFAADAEAKGAVINANILKKMESVFELDAPVLDERTLLICKDVGYYVGVLFQKIDPRIYWCPMPPRYGNSPQLAFTKKYHFEPHRFVEVCCMQWLKNKNLPDELLLQTFKQRVYTLEELRARGDAI